jgi:ATP-dependent helicase Lhr and Lhr-like helicase
MSRSSFGLLSNEIQKIVYDMRWEALTPIQEQAIPAILNTDKHIVIAASTASGKTEAAFLPVLSKVQKAAGEYLKVLYISPIRALINDQFERIERLCTYTEIPVHKWHGDVDFSQKQHVLKNPSGILQITPESLEALFVNRPGAVRSMFEQLEFIVIDEVHAFLGRDRGVHLQSLLGRIRLYCNEPPRIVALSATIGDPAVVKAWVSPGDPDHVELIEANETIDTKGSNESNETAPRILFALEYAPLSDEINRLQDPDIQIPQAIVTDIRELTRHHSAMIFCNSRARAEELSVRLNELVQMEIQTNKIHGMDPGSALYLTHHSSIDRKEREFVEEMMRSSTIPRSVICTSSMELGIDIGQVDLVIQVDATWSVSSLKQRIGRSGRRQGKDRVLQMYAIDPLGLLQAIAVTELMRAGWVEAGSVYPIPYDILFHQMLSICSEHNGLTKKRLLEIIRQLGPFQEISDEEICSLLEHALDHDFLERLVPDEWIIGIHGERILRSIEFYSIFKTPEEYEVYDGGRRLGTIEKNGLVDIGSNLMLGGRLWAIVSIDEANNQVQVVPSSNGSPPRYSGMSVKRDHTIAKKMAEVLFGSEIYTYLMPMAQEQLQSIRDRFAGLKLGPNHRLVERMLDGRYVWQMFAGTDIQRTFQWMVRALGHQARVNESGHIEVVLREESDRTDGATKRADRANLAGRVDQVVSTVTEASFLDLIRRIQSIHWTTDMLLPHVKDHERLQTKYSIYLPNEFRDRMHASSEIDIPGTLQFLEEIQIVEIG